VTAIPSLGEITSNSLSISWNPSNGATGYQVATVDSDWNLVLFFIYFFNLPIYLFIYLFINFFFSLFLLSFFLFL